MSLSTALQLSSDSHFAVPLTMYSLFLAMAHVERMCLRPRVLSRSYSTCRVACRGVSGAGIEMHSMQKGTTLGLWLTLRVQAD